MEDIFIQALAERTKKEEGLMEQLPEDVKLLVEERLSTEVHEAEVIEQL